VPLADGVARLAAGPLPLSSGPPAGPGRWGAWIDAPNTEAGLDQAEAAVARGLAAGACLVAIGGGTSPTRRLLAETARLGQGALTMLVEDEGPGLADTATTAVLSGRADLVGVPAKDTR
jgi:hypothetical protein